MILETGGDHQEEVGEEEGNYHFCVLTVSTLLHNITLKLWFLKSYLFQFVRFPRNFPEGAHISECVVLVSVLVIMINLSDCGSSFLGTGAPSNRELETGANTVGSA